ncbi:hypothetical protein HN51_032726 [Arachis hypogaea]|uniref:Uncharacterized protein LOC107471070 n=2 Tax=Arachis TaxID=3817 RepID=A0A9C6T721_ARADU|nr:uncharacterized protein LOC112716332 [Arachis hypogaea]XP_025624007.1 uncharacterized protein LOC112716332 [Arachis hypogaea]XP_052111149.1 uncharacterized protein LOC107471070 [Arachis duranensis]XP_052111150.1 uncharacterized protein LOC107471070 [Arachis duranensis]QHO17081.1 uncharacterized protein DS421_10g309170 [Arachis hypogaea]QHO17082.1 uncharacterized protein DS421_10g309170 [Arachis hypogaea]RYR33210.1 hypothetical protein Ahy_A10g047767 [Arachis hypogaea]
MEGTYREPSLFSQTVTELPNSNFMMQQQKLEEETQKLVALKKAYADVILNTGKEAAVRVMASEWRVHGFLHELEWTKEEGLRLMLRLKHMLDAKTAEAERASINQQRKIEELEAQLNEAEDVITDLRIELKQVYDELEKTKISQIQSLDEQNINRVPSVEEDAQPETSVSSPNQDQDHITNCNVKNISPTLKPVDDNCNNVPKQSEQLCIPNLEDFYARKPDFASIIMRSKKSELCKNGCTQRVCALEGNMLDEKLLSREEHNQHICLKKRLSAPCTGAKKMEMKKHVKFHKNRTRKRFSYCRSCFHSSCRIHLGEKCKSSKGACSLPSIKLCAICKLKRNKRCGHVRIRSSASAHCKPSLVLKQPSVCNDAKPSYDEYVAKMMPAPPLTNVGPVHESASVKESLQAVNKYELLEKAIEKDNDLEGRTSKNLAGLSSTAKVEIVDIPSSSINLANPKAFEENGGSPGRLLKYTFQRKRKKESLGTADEQIGYQKSAVKQRIEKKI